MDLILGQVLGGKYCRNHRASIGPSVSGMQWQNYLSLYNTVITVPKFNYPLIGKYLNLSYYLWRRHQVGIARQQIYTS